MNGEIEYHYYPISGRNVSKSYAYTVKSKSRLTIEYIHRHAYDYIKRPKLFITAPEELYAQCVIINNQLPKRWARLK